MIQRSKIDVILRSSWIISFVTFLRDMLGKACNPGFRIDHWNISVQCDDRVQGERFLAIV